MDPSLLMAGKLTVNSPTISPKRRDELEDHPLLSAAPEKQLLRKKKAT